MKEEERFMEKKIIYLGSSVTYGSASQGVSFVELLAEKNGYLSIKEAVSGTTLVDEDDTSYLARMRKLPADEKADLFVCQLSTNDATQEKELGVMEQGKDPSHFDTKTVAGAIETIIAKAMETYHCPVLFYTNPRYDSKKYQEMVDLLLELQKKWDFYVLDLWNDKRFSEITQEERATYMADEIHPTYEGYQNWWLPVFDACIKSIWG